MIIAKKYDSLGRGDYGWLHARYHFSFGNYHDPGRMGFGKIRVINDDVIEAGGGFDMHPHRNMEIITYVRQGAITHKDSMGNEGRTEAGDVQVMSAGKGVFHSEYNRESEDTVLYQIWIEPSKSHGEPCWSQRTFPKELVSDSLNLLVSGEEDAALFIHQDAWIYGGRMKAGTDILHPIVSQAYVLVSDGELEVEGQCLEKGDAGEIKDVSEIRMRAIKDAEVILIDVPKGD